MSVTLAGDFVRLAMQELGVLAAGDNPNAADYTDAIDWLNVMLRNWDADESLIPNLTSSSFATVAATATYTAGTAGTAFSTRPVRIVNAYVRWQGVDTQLVVQGKADYNSIQNKTQAGPVRVLYYVPSFPLGTIYFDRVPDQAYTIFCDLVNPVGDYASENTAIAVSPEYHIAIVYNLAVLMAPSYRVVLGPSTVALAKRSLERVQYQHHNAQAVTSRPNSELVV